MAEKLNRELESHWRALIGTAFGDQTSRYELARRVASGRDVRWRSVAAEGFRARLEQQVQTLHLAAEQVSEAAGAVDRHAVAVHRRWAGTW